MFFGISPRLAIILFLFVFGVITVIIRLYPKLSKKDKDSIRPWIVAAAVAAVITIIIAFGVSTLG